MDTGDVERTIANLQQMIEQTQMGLNVMRSEIERLNTLVERPKTKANATGLFIRREDASSN